MLSSLLAPFQVCETELKDDCKEIEREECTFVPEEKCEDVPREVINHQHSLSPSQYHPHQCPDLNLQPGVRNGANNGVHQHPEPAVRRGGGGALRGQVHSRLVVQGMLKCSTTI